MKSHRDALRRSFRIRWALCVVLAITATGALARPGQACGIITHTTIIERAIEFVDEAKYPGLVALLEAYPKVVNYGSMFPDWAVATNPELGELPHDTGAMRDGTTPPFRAALMANLLPAFGRLPGSEDDRKAIAFLLGLISHQEADHRYHDGDGTLPGLQPLYERHGIPHWLFELQSDRLLYPSEYGVEWFLPEEALLAAYRAVDPENKYPMTKNLISRGRMLQQAQYHAEGGSVILIDASAAGMTLRHLQWALVGLDLEEYPAGGLQDCAEHTARAWEQAWEWMANASRLG